jgi:hypothetical protein
MDNLTQNPETTQAAPTRKPRTEAQIAASRANGAKSKGPKNGAEQPPSGAAPENRGPARSAASGGASCAASQNRGKAIASQNALRHGLLGQITLIDGENHDSFLKLAYGLYQTLQPADDYEECIVDTMLTSMWRRTRAMAMETAAVSGLVRKARGLATSAPTQPGATPGRISVHELAFQGIVASPAEQHALDLLQRYESRHTRAFERAAKCLLAYRRLRYQTPDAYPPQPVCEYDTENLPEENLPNDPEPTPTPAPTAQPEPQPGTQIPPNEPDNQQPPVPSSPKRHNASYKRLNRKQRRELLRKQTAHHPVQQK